MSLICALDLRERWRAIDFEVPKLAFYKSNLIFTLVSVVPPLVYHFFFTDQAFVFLTIGICIYLCFSAQVVFQCYQSYDWNIKQDRLFFLKVSLKKIIWTQSFPAFWLKICLDLIIFFKIK